MALLLINTSISGKTNARWLVVAKGWVGAGDDGIVSMKHLYYIIGVHADAEWQLGAVSFQAMSTAIARN